MVIGLARSAQGCWRGFAAATLLATASIKGVLGQSCQGTSGSLVAAGSSDYGSQGILFEVEASGDQDLELRGVAFSPEGAGTTALFHRPGRYSEVLQQQSDAATFPAGAFSLLGTSNSILAASADLVDSGISFSQLMPAGTVHSIMLLHNGALACSNGSAGSGGVAASDAQLTLYEGRACSSSVSCPAAPRVGRMELVYGCLGSASGGPTTTTTSTIAHSCERAPSIYSGSDHSRCSGQANGTLCLVRCRAGTAWPLSIGIVPCWEGQWQVHHICVDTRVNTSTDQDVASSTARAALVSFGAADAATSGGPPNLTAAVVASAATLAFAVPRQHVWVEVVSESGSEDVFEVLVVGVPNRLTLSGNVSAMTVALTAAVPDLSIQWTVWDFLDQVVLPEVRWLEGNWSSCDNSCGTGLQRREVFCSIPDAAVCTLLWGSPPDSETQCEGRDGCTTNNGTTGTDSDGQMQPIEQEDEDLSVLAAVAIIVGAVLLMLLLWLAGLCACIWLAQRVRGRQGLLVFLLIPCGSLEPKGRAPDGSLRDEEAPQHVSGPADAAGLGVVAGAGVGLPGPIDDHPEPEVPPDVPMPAPHSGPPIVTGTAYEDGSRVEYYERVGKRWIHTTVSVVVDTANGTVRYDLELLGTSHHRDVPLSLLRLPLSLGELVDFQHNGQWVPATITEASFASSSFRVWVQLGSHALSGQTFDDIPRERLRRRFPPNTVVRVYVDHGSNLGWRDAMVARGGAKVSDSGISTLLPVIFSGTSMEELVPSYLVRMPTVVVPIITPPQTSRKLWTPRTPTPRTPPAIDL